MTEDVAYNPVTAPGARRRAHRPILIATITSVVPGLPVFLVGGQAVQIREELHLSPGALGLSVAVFFGCTAVFSVYLGRIVQHWGARRSPLATMVTSCVSLLGIAVSQSAIELAFFLAIGGLANSAINPSANTLLASSGAHLPLGLSLGIKQSAPAAASLAGGLAVPLVALTFGWRWSFVCAAALTLLIAATLAGIRLQLAARPRLDSARTAVVSGRRQLVTLAIVAGCGSAAGNSVGVFLDDFGVHGVDLAAGTAGFVFALASVGCLAGRTFFGWLVDRRHGPDPIGLTVALMLSGSVGYLLLATATRPAFVVGAVVAYALAWGWPALLHFAVIRARPEGAARATGVLMAGFATGSFVGPLLLGQVAGHLGYALIWLLMALFCATGGAILWSSHRRSSAPTPGADAVRA